MLSDTAKAEIVGVLAGCFVISVAILICLVCPCPLRAAVVACIERRQSGQKKPFRRSSGNSGPSCDHCSCCLLVNCCHDNNNEYTRKSSRKEGLLLGADVEPAVDQISTGQAKPATLAWLDAHRPAADPAPRVALTFSVTRLPDCLAVHLHGAEGTPGPRLGLCHCNFALVKTVAEIPNAASAYANPYDADDAVRTGIVGQTASPVFNETLVLPLATDEAVGLRLLVRCLDYDRFSRERIVGELRVPLPEEMDHTVQFSGLPMEQPQTEAGDLLVALQYTPAAERLSVIVLKASDIYAQDGSVPTTYLHLVLLANGSVVYKKRTRIFEASSRPVYNEPTNIDLPWRRLDRVSLIVSVMNCHLMRSFRPDLDTCLGYVVFSSICYGSGRAHWLEMASRPKTLLACWHRLT